MLLSVRRRALRQTVLLGLTFGLLVAKMSGAGTPVGAQFQVNTYTTSSQNRAEVSRASNGDFVVVWTSYGSDGTDADGNSIQGRRYASDGAPLGDQFQANVYTTNGQIYPAVGVAPDGAFVVVWASRGSQGTDTDAYSIQGRRYDSGGLPQAGEFQVNTYTTNGQYVPAVDIADDGSFVVVWQSYGSPDSDVDGFSIQGQRYAADGTPILGQFQVNSYTTTSQYLPAIGMTPASDFVVLWESGGSDGSDNSSYSIQVQRYASDGSPQGDQFQANAYTTGSQERAAVDVAADGTFVVTWQSEGSNGSDTEGDSVQGRRFAANGIPLADQFQINEYTTADQRFSAVAVRSDGAFVVAWSSRGSPGSDDQYSSTQSRRYSSEGQPQGTQFQVNTYTTGYQYLPSVSLGDDGEFVVVWQSNGSPDSDSSGASVQGQRLTLQIFADGFESGDTSSWSTTVP